MYKLHFEILSVKYTVTAESLPEILSLALDAFNKDAKLYYIYKEEELLLSYCQIYQNIGRTTY